MTDRLDDDDPTTVSAPIPEAELRPGATIESGQPAATTGDAAEDDFLDDEDYLPQERRGPDRLTVALVAAVVLAIGVLGGVWVDKQFGATTAAAGARGGGQAMSGGMPGGGMPGGGASGMPGGAPGMPGGAASGQPGGATSDGTGGSSTGSTGTPVVVGVVASTASGTLVVTDLGGKKHSVTVSKTTTLTMPYAHRALKSGDTVSISGTTDSDGSVTATGVTVR